MKHAYRGVSGAVETNRGTRVKNYCKLIKFKIGKPVKVKKALNSVNTRPIRKLLEALYHKKDLGRNHLQSCISAL